MRQELQQSFVLHSRSYRDTSLLLEVFAKDFGRTTVIAKGARKPQRKSQSSLSGSLRPFVPLRISWSGRSALKSLTHVEVEAMAFKLEGKQLYSSFYLNELLMLLLPHHDPMEEIFILYAQTLNGLAETQPIEPLLRNFEFALLASLGYGIDFSLSAHSGEPIHSSYFYRFVPEQGFISCGSQAGVSHQVFQGKDILAIAKREYHQQAGVLRTAKYVSRQALSVHLQGKQLKSRELFRSASFELN